MLDTGQIMDDLVPTRRLEGDVVCREYWILDIGYWILDIGYWILIIEYTCMEYLCQGKF